MKSLLLATAALIAGANAFCGDWDSQTDGPYTVSNDLWGTSGATGSQCTQVDYYSNNVIIWETSWTWSVAPMYQVKSYANVGYNFNARTLSSISKIPVIWNWQSTDYASSVYDVSFDTFLAPSASGSHTIEVMIWVASVGGAGPIGSTIATPSINGITWNLHKGPNGSTTVYSFVAPYSLNSVNFDLKPFYNWLTTNGYFSQSEYLTTIQIGTEPFSGSSRLLTSEYEISIE